MIKLIGSVSRKVPIPDKEFSSQAFSAGMELEVSSDASFKEIKDKIKEMYGLLESSVKEQIISNGVPEVGSEHKTDDTRAQNNRITPNQQKLLEKLVRERKIFGPERIRLLNIQSKEEAKVEIKNLIAKRS
jgi:hypothetical protein